MSMPPQRDLDPYRATDMLYPEAAIEGEFALNRKVDALQHANLFSGQRHNQDRLIGVSSIAAHRQVTVALAAVQRFPWQWQPKLRGPAKFRTGAEHALLIPDRPEAILK